MILIMNRNVVIRLSCTWYYITIFYQILKSRT
nr:MAG TPA: hypothetical protein [Caudoviricetes sp.]